MRLGAKARLSEHRLAGPLEPAASTGRKWFRDGQRVPPADLSDAELAGGRRLPFWYAPASGQTLSDTASGAEGVSSGFRTSRRRAHCSRNWVRGGCAYCRDLPHSAKSRSRNVEHFCGHQNDRRIGPSVKKRPWTGVEHYAGVVCAGSATAKNVVGSRARTGQAMKSPAPS